MKTIQLLALTSILFISVSCKKEAVEPTPEEPTPTPTMVTFDVTTSLNSTTQNSFEGTSIQVIVYDVTDGNSTVCDMSIGSYGSNGTAQTPVGTFTVGHQYRIRVLNATTSSQLNERYIEIYEATDGTFQPDNSDASNYNQSPTAVHIWLTGLIDNSGTFTSTPFNIRIDV
ncbi:MAG: hypothetical protein H6599_02010 [Flavobacteriales bacterium]|nr:hypothetical protein [Flavobacteriales bacterium]